MAALLDEREYLYVEAHRLVCALGELEALHLLEARPAQSLKECLALRRARQIYHMCADPRYREERLSAQQRDIWVD